ncbi:pentapeptide repeat-containing protein [Alkalihalobacillus sp. TS-13]|uniref:pentapeptide repeat-containing protein n=1 Tax=Alkalihalobacillus sp. TS-13 TaxID=2842455 RepID=UPI001C87B9DD|nr:pentapeptide repeat-containing protein [Alkalihalobacillus sp. TS-13]
MLNDLKSDCENCFALCCVALPYGKSADFPFDKGGGDPCRNLCSNSLCSIHDQLREKGFQGCVSYECFGAGQHVSQNIFEGKDWRGDHGHAEEMFAVFPLVQQFYEMLWYLSQALTLKETESFQASLQKLYDETVELTEKHPEEILKIDVTDHRGKVNALLIKTSEQYRKDSNAGKKNRVKKIEYIGANLKGLDFKGADFRGKLMIAADLSQCDFRKADFVGADLREANLSGANLKDALFLTQSQINSAKGDQHTKIPNYLERPIHWLK